MLALRYITRSAPSGLLAYSPAIPNVIPGNVIPGNVIPGNVIPDLIRDLTVISPESLFLLYFCCQIKMDNE